MHGSPYFFALQFFAAETETSSQETTTTRNLHPVGKLVLAIVGGKTRILHPCVCSQCLTFSAHRHQNVTKAERGHLWLLTTTVS